MSDLPTEWLQGVDEFNRREYYACHDTLEALWMDSVDPDKKFYQGVLQIAVGCYHLHNHNLKGAIILLGEGSARLPYYQPTYAGIDVTALIRDSHHLLKTLQTLDPDTLGDFVAKLGDDPAILPVVRWVEDASLTDR
jgi:uncharacterized protein